MHLRKVKINGLFVERIEVPDEFVKGYWSEFLHDGVLMQNNSITKRYYFARTKSNILPHIFFSLTIVIQCRMDYKPREGKTERTILWRDEYFLRIIVSPFLLMSLYLLAFDHDTRTDIPGSRCHSSCCQSDTALRLCKNHLSVNAG